MKIADFFINGRFLNQSDFSAILYDLRFYIPLIPVGAILLSSSVYYQDDADDYKYAIGENALSCFANVKTVDVHTAPYYKYNWFKNGQLLKPHDRSKFNLTTEYLEHMTDPQPGLILQINKIKVSGFGPFRE